MSVIDQLIAELEAAGYVMRDGCIYNPIGSPQTMRDAMAALAYDRWCAKEEAAAAKAKAAATPWTWHQGPDGTRIGFWNGYSVTRYSDGGATILAPDGHRWHLGDGCDSQASVEVSAGKHWEAAK